MSRHNITGSEAFSPHRVPLAHGALTGIRQARPRRWPWVVAGAIGAVAALGLVAFLAGLG